MRFCDDSQRASCALPCANPQCPYAAVCGQYVDGANDMRDRHRCSGCAAEHSSLPRQHCIRIPMHLFACAAQPCITHARTRMTTEKIKLSCLTCPGMPRLRFAPGTKPDPSQFTSSGSHNSALQLPLHIFFRMASLILQPRSNAVTSIQKVVHRESRGNMKQPGRRQSSSGLNCLLSTPAFSVLAALTLSSSRPQRPLPHPQTQHICHGVFESIGVQPGPLGRRERAHRTFLSFGKHPKFFSLQPSRRPHERLGWCPTIACPACACMCKQLRVPKAPLWKPKPFL